MVPPRPPHTDTHICASSPFTAEARSASAVEAVPALAVQCVLVFGGHSAVWGGCSVATIARTPDAGGWEQTKPLSALLNDWQNPKAMEPLSGAVSSFVYGYAVRPPLQLLSFFHPIASTEWVYIAIRSPCGMMMRTDDLPGFGAKVRLSPKEIGRLDRYKGTPSRFTRR